MRTLFGKSFLVASIAGGGYGSNGAYVPGTLTSKQVFGTIQSVSAKDSLAFEMGTRDAGKVKIFSSEKLSVREQGISEGDYISYGGRIYQLFFEMPFLNGIISHYKYYAELCPKKDITAGVAEALGVV